MDETTEKDTSSSNKTSTIKSAQLLTHASSVPATSTSPLTTNPWYKQKFELYRDVIEEKIRGLYPELPQQYELKPANIECSTMKGYDLDFPIELHDGQSTIASISYGSGCRPPYTKEERLKLVMIRQNTVPNN